MLHVLRTAQYLKASLLITTVWCILQRNIQTGALRLSSALQSCVSFKMEACDSTEQHRVSPWVSTDKVQKMMHIAAHLLYNA